MRCPKCGGELRLYEDSHETAVYAVSNDGIVDWDTNLAGDCWEVDAYYLRCQNDICYAVYNVEVFQLPQVCVSKVEIDGEVI